MVYLDHCSTTPLHADVIQAMTEVMKRYYGNPSSLHHLGIEAGRMLSRAREVIAESIAVKPEEILFTSGGTESNNLAIKGYCAQYRHRGNHLITSMIEHSSVFETFKQLEAEGFDVTYLLPNREGFITEEAIEQALRPDTMLVSVMHINNEVGMIQPIQAIGQLLKQKPKIAFHVDAIQSLGKLAVAPYEMHVDLMSFSAHKVRGPKGMGFLYRRKGMQLKPLLTGGGQEFGERSGTENVPQIVGMAKAVRLACEQHIPGGDKLRKLRACLQQELSQIKGIIMNGAADESSMAPHLLHFSAPAMKAQVLLQSLEKRGFYVSSQSACSSGSENPSRVLLAMGCTHEQAISGIRVSFSTEEQEFQMKEFAQQLNEIMTEWRQVVAKEEVRS